ncbi:mitochondrial inner membrane protein OXA1-like [Andrographis paniculata]|uniref:mitochondrial inner membrane protein OXA1-like n=1 Tax=Andrographis paniculata TaxID=175694 RepID=UPI0021E8AF02|nr:mitochondrial inner membrane protein OXA1-like [Andrographis paniculata]XP_051127156.1 mitochondrial inner membrane protein OXA1-like [Andrographis paniculata]
MAYRRNITARAKFFYQQQQRVAPSFSFSHVHRDDSDREELRANPTSANSATRSYFQRCFWSTGNNSGIFHGSRNLFQDRRFAIAPGCGTVLGRNYSTGTVGDESAGKVEIFKDVVDAFEGTAVEVAGQVAPQLDEVAIAAADSFFPVAALQYMIDYVHTFTGLPWWASISLATLMIRFLQLPLIINQLKATSKFTLLRPKLEAIKEEMQERNMSPAAVAEGQARMKSLFKEYGVTPFTPLRGILITGPIFCCFFFAIRNMVEKVPSFKEGGMLWFTDLSVPDSMYVFPVLTALTFWITVELNAQEGLEGNPTAGMIKNISRGFAVLTVPLTATFPNGIFCYWITSNLFSLCYGLVMKRPAVKNFLGIPIIPLPPPSTSTTQKQPEFSFFGALRKYAESQQRSIVAAQQQQQQQLSSSSPEASPPKPVNQRIPSSSVLNQRIRSLEKEVKGRKRGKKR